MLRSVLAAIVFAASASAVPALATPQPINGTDMWFNPAESGWGINLFHQGSTIFAALFVYGSDGQPRWYVGSSLDSSDGATFTGGLFEATGSWFGLPFDEGAVTRRQVGTMTIVLGRFSTVLDYTVDGVHVRKDINRFTFRTTGLSGLYAGYLYQPAANGAPEIRQDWHFTIQDNGSSLTLFADSDREGSGVFSGTKTQLGQVADASGTYTVNSRTGTWSMSDVDVTPNGLTGSFVGNGISPTHGRIALSRRSVPPFQGNGYRTDTWFPPRESGWGFNVVEQGDTIFGTLFVYDQQNRTHWYVASQLTQSDNPADGSATYTGALYETHGPYFGAASFDPAAVTRRQVGTMSFQAFQDGTAKLNYSVDGVAVSKELVRFAFRVQTATGHYVGHIVGTPDNPGGVTYNTIDMTIDEPGGSFSMQSSDVFSNETCNYSAPFDEQRGQLRYVSHGTFSCSSGRAGTFQIDDLMVTWNGFTGRWHATDTGSLANGPTIKSGNIEGARRDLN
jgi:hypothetical protein